MSVMVVTDRMRMLDRIREQITPSTCVNAARVLTVLERLGLVEDYSDPDALEGIPLQAVLDDLYAGRVDVLELTDMERMERGLWRVYQGPPSALRAVAVRWVSEPDHLVRWPGEEVE